MVVDDLLNSQPRVGRVGLAARTALAVNSSNSACPRYFEALENALRFEPSPFDTPAYEEIYQTAALDPFWMNVSLITNAEREGDGAKRLWSLAFFSDDPVVKLQLKQHAVDESRHALFYLALVDLTFPNAVDPDFRLTLNSLSPQFTMAQELFSVQGSPYAKIPSIDDFVQMNIAEIRTTIHHIMQRRAISKHCSPEKQAAISGIQDSLLKDELRHVAYTAVLIEALADSLSNGGLMRLFRRRLRDFNQITLDELGRRIFD